MALSRYLACVALAAVSACSAPWEADAPRLGAEVSGDGFTLKMPEGATFLKRAVGGEKIEYRVVDPKIGTLVDVMVWPSGEMLPLEEGETISSVRDNPRVVSRIEADGERHVVGYIWKRKCTADIEIGSWAGIDFVSSTPDPREHDARRALADAVAASLRPTSCKAE
ncbi:MULTISPECIES: hypothetical protein [unclassified Brevundimonas]|uniref:hypothetical protein n=1 Tax=unclassified Brevundimonas TaxID=2622653 RepID=UPI0011B0EBBC|nr:MULTISPECIES: hypothetical protein [unclassified Brevundimonas]